MSNLGPSLRGAVDLSGLVRRANTPPPAPGAAASPGTAPASGVVVEVTEATFPQIVELSTRVPVVVELYAPGLEPALGAIVESYGGRLVLATVDAQANPGIAEAFQVREVPAAAGVLGGRPVPLFVGTPADDQVRQVFDQLLQVAAQNGITGSIDPNAAGAEGADTASAEPVEEPLPPLHQEAYDAISTGDYASAVAAYQKAIAQNPRDALAVAGLAQASLLQRLDGAVADDLRKVAADAPGSVAAQLAVADLDVSGGHLDDAFDRLLDLFPSLDGAGREAVRERILEYFEIAGADDPRVAAARRRLTLLLY